MWELDGEESWALKNWCFWIVVLEKTVESPLDCKKIQPVHPRGDQSWVFIGKTDVETETPILWPLDAKNWLTGKDPDAGKRLKAGEGDNSWDGWTASPMWWTWVWVGFRSWWWTGKLGMLQSMGSQSDTTEWLKWIELNYSILLLKWEFLRVPFHFTVPWGNLTYLPPALNLLFQADPSRNSISSLDHSSKFQICIWHYLDISQIQTCQKDVIFNILLSAYPLSISYPVSVH